MSHKKFLIIVDTEWAGTQETYSAIAESEDELMYLADDLSYDNYIESDGDNLLLNLLFPDAEECTDDMQEIIDTESINYYWSSIYEVDENNEKDMEKFNNCELVYDSRN